MAGLIAPIAPDHAECYADRLLETFGSLGAAISAGTEMLRRTVADDCVIEHLALLRDAHRHALRGRVEAKPVLSTSAATVDYLRAMLAYERDESVFVLYLNAANRLLTAEMAATGTIDRAPLYPQPILRRALELGALALIVAHNHPSGDHQPSVGDRASTQQLVAAAAALDIRVHDHLVLSPSGWTSFFQLGWL